MIDGTQLLTMFAAGAYMFIGAIVGFIAGLILIPSFCVLHPVVLAWWERYRMMVEIRKHTRQIYKTLVDTAMSETREATSTAVAKVFAEPPSPPPNEVFKKGG